MGKTVRGAGLLLPLVWVAACQPLPDPPEKPPARSQVLSFLAQPPQPVTDPPPQVDRQSHVTRQNPVRQPIGDPPLRSEPVLRPAPQPVARPGADPAQPHN